MGLVGEVLEDIGDVIEDVITLVFRARKGTNSVRTTVPSVVAKVLGICPGDRVQWSVKKIGNEKVAIVKKKEVKE